MTGTRNITSADAAIRFAKADIRKRVLARRDALTATERGELSARITARLVALPAYRNAARVMAYLSFGGEFETARFIAALQSSGKSLVLPRVERGSRRLALHEVRDIERDVEPGVWGILQPRAEQCLPVRAADVDFVLVPGVAFTRAGARLGYGGGYYDAFIGGLEHAPALIAAAFELQIVPALPMSDTDQRVDGIVTERAGHPRGDS